MCKHKCSLVRIILGALTCWTLAACQQAPTKVTEVQYREFDVLVDKSARPIVIAENTVVLDTRPAFEYGLNHINNSIHFPYDKLLESSRTGELMRDTHKLALRLSLLGLNPRNPVVVVGRGPKGTLDEARVAWALLYFGFQDVQTASIDLFREQWTSNPSPQPTNAPAWNLTLRDTMVISPEEYQNLAEDPKGRLEKRVFILDVRGSKEFQKQKGLDTGAINIDLKEFFESNGRANRALKKQLNGIGISERDRLIVVSGEGDTRATAAAYALLALGYARVETPLIKPR